MGRKRAALLAGTVTAFVMVVVTGLAAASGWYQAIAPANTAGDQMAVSTTVTTAAEDSATVQQLQQQVAQYRSELQQAYSDLQTAYDQINQLQQVQDDRGRHRSSESEREGESHERSAFLFGFGDD